MAKFAAAFAASSLLLWVVGIALMSTAYQQTGVLFYSLGFIPGIAHAIAQWQAVNRVQATSTAPVSGAQDDTRLEPDQDSPGPETETTDQNIETNRSESMTTTTASPTARTHPLQGHESAATAWFGFFTTVLLSIVLFYVLTGWWVPPTLTLGSGVQIGPEVLVPLSAFLFYLYQKRVSLTRPNTWGYGLLDFIGSAGIFIVTLIAVLSWLPPFASMLRLPTTLFGLPSFPVAAFTTLAVVTGVTYLVGSFWDVFWNHWSRRRLGTYGLSNVTVAGTMSGTAGDPDFSTMDVWRPNVLVGAPRLWRRDPISGNIVEMNLPGGGPVLNLTANPAPAPAAPAPAAAPGGTGP